MKAGLRKGWIRAIPSPKGKMARIRRIKYLKSSPETSTISSKYISIARRRTMFFSWILGRLTT
jgi:hypothetical protein